MTVLAAAMSAFALGLVLRAVSERTRPKLPGRRTTEVTGLDVTWTQFWLTSIGAGLVTFLLVLGLTGLAVVALIPAVVVAALPRSFFVRKRARRIAAVQAAWPDGLRDLVGSVKAGLSLPSALESLGRYGPEPLRDAFGSFDVYSRSLGVVAALEMVRSDLADPTSDRVIEVLILAHERGGKVVPEILSDLAEAATRDVWTLEQVRSEALEQTINSRIVFVLPWFVLVAITFRDGAFREFYATRTGLVVVLIGGLMSLVGIALASRIGSQPTEPRVFIGAKP